MRGAANKADVKDTLTMTVEQKVCNACRAGLGSADKLPGAIRSFSLEYPNL